MRLLIIGILLVNMPFFSFAKEYFSKKESTRHEVEKIIEELPKDKINELLLIRKNIIEDEIEFKNKLISLRSLSNKAMQERNEVEYKAILSQINVLKNERNIVRAIYKKQIENILQIELPINIYMEEEKFEYKVSI
ncbi:hypothetical protein [Fusobacterium perfoetens]|uniref:hypothetical protein n=1 Tax=Fusobacterium perfoetens TaxID=852 RepID=UPI000489F82C|nr:hypothetical protein [Fusobacterium perfoetens]MCI6152724.1 hypothetical protein [Fusobacterium perfoetens]MDY3236618.1 hypothetical protein [Fusobacterium perfoetens]